MKTFLAGLAAAVIAAACTDPVPGALPPELTGQWNYALLVSAGPEDQCSSSGTLDLTQNGATIDVGATRYTGCPLLMSNVAGTGTVTDGGEVSITAGTCVLTGTIVVAADSASGSAHCTTPGFTWDGTWHAARTSAPVSITITPGDIGMVLGATQAYGATVLDAKGHTLRGRTIVWTSGTPAVATVAASTSTEQATVTGVASGTSILTAATGTLQATATINVASVSFVHVYAGGFSCGLTAAGEAWCWGQLFLGPSSLVATSPVQIVSPVSFTSLAVGQTHACGLSSVGAAWCWGTNGLFGSLGTGDSASSAFPRAVTGGHVFAALSAGSGTTCGLTAAGAAWCWGAGAHGELGNNAEANSPVPVAVAGARVFSMLRTFSQHTCGTTGTGAYCWGLTTYGELGNGDTTSTQYDVPQLVGDTMTFASVSPGGIHSCGLNVGGAAFCWGNGTFGTMGNGTNVVRNPSPLAVSGGRTYSALQASHGFSCALSSGTAYCWGSNNLAQLGDGTANPSNVPVAVVGGRVFTEIAAGDTHSCGLSAGIAYCWGYNQFGAIGDGTQTFVRTAPTRVIGQP